jgi:hypothetical protein
MNVGTWSENRLAKFKHGTAESSPQISSRYMLMQKANQELPLNILSYILASSCILYCILVVLQPADEKLSFRCARVSLNS